MTRTPEKPHDTARRPDRAIKAKAPAKNGKSPATGKQTVFTDFAAI